MKAIHANSVESYAEYKRRGGPGTYREAILDMLTTAARPMTDREIFERLATDINNVRPEVTRMIQEGQLLEAGRVRCPKTGRAVRTTRIVNETRQELLAL